jgi:NAD-dependent deacetylase sirtuin 4
MARLIPATRGNVPSMHTASLESLVELLRGRRIVALVGAGCSTESGIPDYRGPNSRPRTRPPIQYLEFTRNERARIRYWTRSAVGWPRIATATPNPSHYALARLERAGLLAGVITQNVDGLHFKAGSERVVELHGSLSQVCCLSCRARFSRASYQERLLAANPEWARHLHALLANHPDVASAPDGDAALPDHLARDFHVPPCEACGGICKPDVVFFGENVPPDRVDAAWKLFEAGDVLLVAGSSLTVYSGRRFVYRARDEGKPVGIINIGPTRADDLAAARVEGRLGDVLPRLVETLLSDAAPLVEAAFQ